MSLLIFPGLIDAHVHLRDPGQTDKEDFYTGTMAALAGGFTTVADMPNNLVPITTGKRLKNKINLAKQEAVCDIGFYFGSTGDNISEFKKVSGLVLGLKLFLNPTTGNLLINEENLEKVYQHWQGLILVHAEDEKVLTVLTMVKKYRRRTHFCHMSSINELKPVIKAKEDGLPVTCGVTPHHLWLKPASPAGGEAAKMKPPIEPEADQKVLWQALLDGTIDLVESDHAPHLKEENMFGVTGLETTLGLMLLGAKQKKCSLDQVKKWLYDNPRKIFKIPEQKAEIEFDPEKSWTVENQKLKTKCGWSPFSGWQLYGKVEKITYAKS